MQRGSRHRHLAHDDHIIYLCQGNNFFACRNRGRAVLPFSLRNLDEQAIFAITPHIGVVFSEIQSRHDYLLFIFSSITGVLHLAGKEAAGCNGGSVLSKGVRAEVVRAPELLPGMLAQWLPWFLPAVPP